MLIVDLSPDKLQDVIKYVGWTSLTCKSALKMLTMTSTGNLALDAAATVMFLLGEIIRRLP
jgi:hypothetical protein